MTPADLPDLPTLDDAPVVAPEPEPDSHDDDNTLPTPAPGEPGEDVEP